MSMNIYKRTQEVTLYEGNTVKLYLGGQLVAEKVPVVTLISAQELRDELAYAPRDQLKHGKSCQCTGCSLVARTGGMWPETIRKF